MEKKIRVANENPLGRQAPPQSIDAEASLLSAVLIDGRIMDELADSVSPADFYRTAHRLIFEGMLALSEKKEPIDLVTLADLLKKKNALKAAGGGVYLSRLLDAVPAAAHAASYADIIREKAILRTLIERAYAIIKQCRDESHSSREVIDFAERSLLEIVRHDVRTGLTKVENLLEGSIDSLKERQARQGLPSGVESGFGQLDGLTAGFQKSDLIILAARPSVGKTALALNIARNAAVDGDKAVGIFSLEMSKEQLVMRLLCAESRVSSSRFKDGFITVENWSAITSAAGTLQESAIYIDDSPHNTAMTIRAKARRLKMEQGLDLLIVDYLQLMKLSQKTDRRDLEIAEISKSLKALARELEIPVIALSQLNRQLEMRDDKRPRLADLRESGALEQDADVVLLIHREEVYQNSPASGADGHAELIVAKHRNGPTGSVHLTFLKSISRFENYAASNQGGSR